MIAYVESGALISFSIEQSRLASIVDRCGALLKGHFRLLSGKHSDYFLRFSHIGRDRDSIFELSRILAPRLPDFDSIVTPETAGLFLASALTHVRDVNLAVVGVDAQRRPTTSIRRARTRELGRVLLVNDVVTSQRSLAALERVATDHGGTVVGAAAFVRHLTAPKTSIPLVTAGEARWPVFDSSECSNCKDGVAWIWAGELS